MGDPVASVRFRQRLGPILNRGGDDLSSAPTQELRDHYLDLIKRALLNLIYVRAERTTMLSRSSSPRKLMSRFLRRLGIYITEQADPALLLEGRCWPMMSHTMIGQKRLDNIQYCVEQVLQNDVPGDLIEAGVWRGGACILMRAVLRAYGVPDRQVWVADSFAGLPAPSNEIDRKDPAGKHFRDRELAVSLEEVQENFRSYGLLDGQVRFLKGWFKESLPNIAADKFSVIRLDGDLYESTMDAIRVLYPKLSVGGYLIVDDYLNIAACKKAVDDYRKECSISEPIQEVDWTGVYWKREK